MKIVCDACSAKYSIADEKVRGKVFKIRCKKCSNIIVVRGSTEEAEKQAAEALEQKETRVFDYSGYDNPQDAVAAADASEAAGGVWHIVVDQEQVGPMTADEVRGYVSRGEADPESYIWREGFDDWQAIIAVPEFADLAGAAMGGSSTDSAAAAMFGAPATDDLGGPASDPADIFSAQAQGSANLGDDAGGGLFGDVGGEAMTASAPDAGGGLFDSAPADPGGNGESPNLTGQRSENSVLFSLNNLASLASEGPKSPSPAASAAPAGMAQAGGQEGSGLIDIRSMAQVYLGDKASPSMSPGIAQNASIDDLPIFSQPSFEAAAPVLLPASAPANQNKVLIGLVAAVGVLVIAAVILMIIVLKGGDKETTVASNTDDVTKNKGGDGDGDGDKAKPAGDGDTTKAAGDGDGDTTKSAGDGDGDKSAAGKVVDKKVETPKKPEKPKTAAELKKERERDKKRAEEREKKKAERAEKKRLEAEKARNKPTGGKCDEVTCLVDPSKACCKGSGRKTTSDKPKANSNLPEKLGSSDIRKGMGKVNGRARSCGNKHSGSGKVAVRISVGGSGRVSSASASGATPKLRSCVASAVKRARFKATQKGARFTYKYSF